VEAPLVNSGISSIGNISWGTHFCQFYQTKEDLLDLLVPYFRAGLENNEFCMWVTAEPLRKEEAKVAMANVMPDFSRYLACGQIEILRHDEWYLKDGVFDLKRVLNGWVDKLNEALKQGYEGMRVTGNAAWLERNAWENFLDYEAQINGVIGRLRMLALCTYPLHKCSASDIIEVVNNHEFALLKRHGKWELIESAIYKQTKEALAASEERFRSIFEESPIGIEIYDLEGALVTANKACLEIFGVSDLREVSGFKLFEDPNLTDDIKQKLKRGKTVRYEGPFDFEKVRQRKLYKTSKSGVIYLDVLITPMSAKGNGEHGGYLVQVQDISERKKSEEVLRESQRDLNRAQAVARTGSWRLDVWRNELLWSEETHRMFGIPKGTPMTYETFLSAVHHDDREYVDRKWKAALRGEPYDIEHRIVVANEVKWVREKAELEFDEGGTLLSGFGTVQDITELKRAEDALRRAKEEWEQTFDTVPDMVAIPDNHHRIVRANRAMTNRLRITPDECVGARCYEVVHGLPYPPAFCPHSQTCCDGKEHTAEIHEPRLEGDFMVSTSPRFDEHGNLIGAVHVARDITERKQAEDSLRRERDNLVAILEAMKDGVFIVNQEYDIQYINSQFQKDFGPLRSKKCYEYFHNRGDPCPWCSNEEVFAGKTVRSEWYSPKSQKTYDLVGTPIMNPDGSLSKLEIFRDITERKKVDQLKDEFIGLVSHELRSPLTVIIGALNTLLTEETRLTREEMRQLLDDAAGEADSLAHILGNLLELSRAQAKRLFLSLEPVDIRNVIKNAVQRAKRQSSKHRFSINVPREVPRVHADSLRLERVLYNLLENAVKYSPDGGPIRTFVKIDSDHLIIGVSDQGPGISEEDQAKLFSPFQRLETSTVRGVKGAGLGLLVCRRLVEAHGGNIWVESGSGKGSTFYFSLPLSKPADEDQEAISRNPAY
jgi:PAS domain S-box-containing protein